MSNKRKRDLEIVDVTDESSSVDAILDGIKLQSMIKPDLASIADATRFTRTIELNLDDEEAASLIRICVEVASTFVNDGDIKDEARVGLAALFESLSNKGLFINSANANALLCACAVSPYCVSFEQPLLLDRIRPGDRHGLIMWLRSDWLSTGACAKDIVKQIPISSQQYLDTTVVESGRVWNSFKTAAANRRVEVLGELIRRLPCISFDVVHLSSPLAEPISLSMPTDGSEESKLIRRYVVAGEKATTLYFSGVKSTVSSVLKSTSLHVDDLISIVQAYAARMPLSTTPLILP